MQTFMIDWHNREKYSHLVEEQHRLRNEVFVKRLGWDVPSHDGLESDAYDTPRTTYAVTVGDTGRICAVSRLLPTTEPYMTRDLWPSWSSERLPCSPWGWEASRFGCCASLTRSERSEAIEQLFGTIYRFSRSRAVDYLMMVMPMFIFERNIKRLGYDVTYLGGTRKIDGLLSRRLARVQIGEPRAMSPEAPALMTRCG
jgi:N-acyl-L-homoserine lactone synthetase